MRRKIAWQASSQSARRDGPMTRATMARTRAANFVASASPAARSPARYALARAAQSSGGQSHWNITAPAAAATHQDQGDVVQLRPRRQRRLDAAAQGGQQARLAVAVAGG